MKQRLLRRCKLYLGLSLVLMASIALCAQAQTLVQPPVNVLAYTPWVTASATAERVRLAASAEVYRMRLEVFAASSEKLFDSDFRFGNVLDWQAQDQQGQRLADGIYRCLVTARDLREQTHQRQGLLLMQAGQVSLREPGRDPLALREANPFDKVDHRDYWTIWREGSAPATTLLSHDGSSGRVGSTSGGLSFRTGDFFAGKDVERVRLTPEGHLGIGVENPQARLDIDGMIRTSEGIMFPDGTIQTTAANVTREVSKQSQSGKSANAAALAPVTGSGTTGFVTRWSDGPNSVLANSAIFQNGSGNIGIGTTIPNAKLHINGTGIDNNGSTAVVRIVSGNGAQHLLLDGNEIDALADGLFLNNNTNQNVILARGGGNVGISTTTPNSKLHVLGPGGGAVVATIEQPHGINFFDLRSSNGGGNYGSVIRFVDSGILNAEIKSTANGQLRLATSPDSIDQLIISSDGNVGVGTTNPTAKLDVAGMTKTQVLQITGGADLSEQFDVKAAPDSDSAASPQQVQPGMVVSIDADNPGKLVVSNRAYDRRVAGIISGAGGVNPGMLMGQAGSVADGSHPVALTGRVYCWADVSTGPIYPGDLLTASNIPGHAMKVTDHVKAQGAIIGKAMTGLKEGKGLVLVLVKSPATAYGYYDFDSVMHYGQCSFAANVCPPNTTITVLPPYDVQWQNAIGQRTHLSDLDRASVSFLYPFAGWRFLDTSYNGRNGSPNGSFHRPYKTFAQAMANTPAGGTIWLIRTQTIPAVGTYDKRITVRAAPGVTGTLGG